MKLSETGTEMRQCWWKCRDPCGYSESCISISKIIWIELSILYAFLSWTFENKEGKNRCVNVLRVKSAVHNRGKVQNAPKSAEDSVLNAISIISQWVAMIYVDKPKKFFQGQNASEKSSLCVKRSLCSAFSDCSNGFPDSPQNP